VALQLTPSSQTYAATAGADGRWTRSIDTGDLSPAAYTALATAVAPDAATSEQSQPASFELRASVTEPVATCDGKGLSDVNCDTKVNLVDFSIMLYYWLQAVEPGNRSDMNRDGAVNIVDFSILLYQWTGN
jgi:hypothetical protein